MPLNSAKSHVFLRLPALFSAALLLLAAGCVTPGGNGVDVADASPPDDHAQAVYNALAAELAGKRRQFGDAADYYLRAAELSDDPRAAERAVRFALVDDDFQRALAAAKRWAVLRPDEPSARLALMRLNLRAGDIEAAKVEARQYLIHQGAGPEGAFAALTGSLGEESDRDGAAAVMAHLAAMYPNVPEAQYSLALLAVDAGQNDVALKAIRTATAARADWKEARVLQSRIALRAGNVEEAMQAVESLVAENPDDIGVRMNYGRMLVEQDKREEARAQFEAVLESSAKNGDALFILGLMALEDDRNDEAKKRFLELFKSGQKTTDAAFYLGVIAEDEKKLGEAIGWYRQVSQGDSALRAQIRVGQLLARDGKVEQGLNHLRDIRANNAPLAPRLLQAEADLLLEAGRSAEALQVHNEAVALSPKDADVLYSRSLALEKTGDVVGAMDDLKAVLEFDADNISALNALGYMLANHSQRYDEALALINKALQQSPEEAAIIDSYGWVLFKKGQVADAVTQLRKAYELFPDPEVAAHYGEALLALGNSAAARSVWQQAVAAERESEARPNATLRETLQRLAPDLGAPSNIGQ